MATGYLVTLGDGSLDAGDYISGSQSTFTIDSTLGTGEWNWSGVWDGDGQFYSNINDTGTYYLGSDGNVYFIPDNWFTTSGDASVISAPAYSAGDNILTGGSGDDVIEGGFTDEDGEVIDGGDGTGAFGNEDTVSAGAGNDSVNSGLEADLVYGGGGQDTLGGGSGNDTIYGDTDPNQGAGASVSITTANVGDTSSGFTVTAQNVVGGVLTAPSAANVADGGGWFGAGGTVSDTDSGVQQQIAYDLASGISETLIVDFDNPITELSFTTYSLQTASFGEVGHYDVYNGGVLVGSSDFTDSTGTGNDTFTVSGFGDFDQIVFTALIQTDLTDGSDYGISDITFTPSLPASDPDADSIDGGDGDDLIYGEVGGDTLGGGSGDDTIYGDSVPLQYDSIGGSNTVGSTFTVINLGNYADADPIETDGITDNAGDLSLTYGGAGAELYNNFQTAETFDSNLDGNLGDDDNGATPEDIVIDGTTYNVDSATVYNATVTFTDGTSGAFTAVVFQTTTGDVFLAPELSNNTDNILLTSKPIESVTLGTVSVADTFLAANRLDADYALPASEGTAADADYIDGGAGNDSLLGNAGNDTIFGADGADTILGGDGDDNLDGDHAFATGGADSIDGGAGDDQIIGDTGNDTLIGGSGNDTIYAGDNDDTVSGDDGNDLLYGEGGDDFITTGAGTDTVFGGAGDDTIQNGEGNDSLVGGDGNDSIVASGGDDTLEGNAGNDTLEGGADNDSLDGGTGNDTLDGGTGNDTLISTSGNDTLTGGDDADTFNVIAGSFADGAVVTVNGGTLGTDSDTLNLTSWTAYKNLSQTTDPDTDSTSGSVEVLDASNNWITVNFNEIETLNLPAPHVPIVDGTAGDDTMGVGYTDAQGDIIDGADGNDDTIYGYGGNDSIDAGVGNDTVDGGTGNDTLFGDAGDDSVLGGDGDDTLSVEFTLDNDTLEGGETGETSGDMVNLGGINDDLTVNLTTVDDGTITDGTNTTQFQDIERFILGQGDDSYTGGAGDDEVFAQAGNDTLNGNLGNDTLFGEAGDDSVEGGAGDDVLFGGTGTDTLSGGTGADYMSGGDDEDVFLVDGGFGNDTIFGGEGAGTTTDYDTVTLIGSEDLTINMSGADAEAGTISNGTDTATYNDIEKLYLSGGNETIILGDGGGSRTVENFDLTDSGDGTTNDQLDVSGLTSDGGTTPVTTADVTVTNDGSGNAVLTFPGGESITLIGVAPTSVDSVDELVAIGIPDGRDYIIEGTAGNDFISDGYLGDPEGDLVDNNDNAAGNNDDSILAGDGNDTVIAALGNDTVDAGAGDDSVRGGDGNDTILGNTGNDILLGEGGNDSVSGGAGTDSMLGGLGEDTLEGGDDADTILGEGGNDSIDGDLGNDSLSGGDDSDTVAGGAGEDEVFGNAGNDLLYGGTENDSVYGGTGDDTMFGDAGDDRMEGWLGNDSMVGGAGDDYLDGASGDDTLLGQDGNDTLASGSDGGADLVIGGTGNDSLTTGDGNDTLEGGLDDDSMFGGGGDDLFVLEDDFGNDTIEGWGTSETSGDTLDATAVTGDVTVDLTAHGSATDPESGTISDGTSTATFADIENITLGAGDDSIIGSDGNDTIAISTGAGADTIDGGAGNDAFDIGAGDGANDTIVLADGDGDDTITGFEAPTDNGDGTFDGNDQLDLSGLTDAGGAQVNTDDVSVTDTNGDGTGDAILQFPNGESITLVGVLASDVSDPAALQAMGVPAPDYIVEGTASGDVINSAYTGDPEGDRVDAADNPANNNDDSILAGAGNDTISAGFGNDGIDAGIGDDQVFGEDGNDTVLAGDGADTVFGEAGDDSLTGGLGNDSMLGGTGNDALLGEVGDDTLRGEDGNDTIFGGDGDDSAHGGNGDDSISGGLGNDELHGWYGNDTIDGGDGNDYIDADLGEDLAIGGDGNDTIMGGFSVESDTLQGGAGDDSIDGQAGNDLIEGGLGDDTLLGSDGDDTFTLTDSFGNDTITGGETDETNGDSLDASAVTADTTLDLTAGIASDPESGTLSDGTSTAGFSEIENITLGTGNDSVIGSSGDDTVSTGTGADTVDGGAGNDTFDIGAGDGANDTVVMQDGDGDDTIAGFEGPIDNGDGTFTGQDQIDTSGLTDADGNPVLVSDVTVIDDGSGNAVLNFPNGESITLIGVAPADVTDHDALAAMGIAQSDYIVDGTAGNDLIDGTYSGDPDGDFVDNLDSQANGNEDSIVAGAGNDTILAGDGNDSIEADEGDDSVLGGAGDDEIFGFEGNDTVDGGAGDDFINTRTSPGTGLPDEEFNSGTALDYGADADPNNDRDSVIGGDGNDTILSGDDNDTVIGGLGDDSVDAGFDDDTVTGDAGNDTLEGNEGDDTIAGGAGDDVIYGELSPTNPDYAGYSFYELENDGSDAAPANNEDSLSGGDGNDSIYGQDDNDTLLGGAGDDLLDGGIDADSLDGGTGSDVIIGGAGNDTITASQGDTITGGDGDDYFTLADFGEAGNDSISITGGEGFETTGDTLYLGPDANKSDITFSNTDDTAGGLSGSFTLNGSLVSFSEIENIICFTPGTRILTAHGERRIEDLREGDTVVTRDHGLRPIRWIGKRAVPGKGRFAPVRVGVNALEGAREGLLVSPQHRILFTGYRAELLFGEPEVLVPAKHLIDGREVVQTEVDEVTYIHLMFDRHEVIYAEGIATESFHAGDVGLDAVDEAAREELFAIFPELRSAPYRHGKTARTCLKAHEAKLIKGMGF